MIYNDSQSQNDTEKMPAERDREGCENCGTTFWEHSGWRCPNSSLHGITFSNLPQEHRYLTASMQASIAHTNVKVWEEVLRKGFAAAKLVSKPEEPKPVDLSDWRAWAHNKPGDCPCGIAKANCEFHR